MKRYLFECFGTCIFIFGALCGSMNNNSYNSSLSFFVGLCIALCYSEGHMNLLVSVSHMITKKIKVLDGLKLILSQFVGMCWSFVFFYFTLYGISEDIICSSTSTPLWLLGILEGFCSFLFISFVFYYERISIECKIILVSLIFLFLSSTFWFIEPNFNTTFTLTRFLFELFIDCNNDLSLFATRVLSQFFSIILFHIIFVLF